MRTAKFVWFTAFTVLFGCTSQSYRIHILFDNVEGLEENAPLKSKGVEIGKVSEFDLKKEGVLVAVDVQQDIAIPKNSDFQIVDSGLIGFKMIEVTLSDGVSYYKHGDTIIGQPTIKTKTEFETTVNAVRDYSTK